MQKRSTARVKPTETQRRPPAARSGQMLAVPAALAGQSSEVTIGGHADRGLTLDAFYETKVLERLRLEVRVRLLLDLTISLAWLHENPRLMAAYSHLTITPSTIVIGLDGVARVDVRAAKKRSTQLDGLDIEYMAPELSVADAPGDHRADIFSLGVLAWEALAGRRLFEDAHVPVRSGAAGGSDDGDLPATLARPERDAGQRKPGARSLSKESHARLRLAPPPLTLPAGAEWALPLFELAVQAMNLDVSLRPQDCRSILAQLDLIDLTRLASHQEIAEVVQGISSVATLCVPEPTLPSVDASCLCAGAPIAAGPPGVEACSQLGDVCVQPPAPASRVLPVLERAPAPVAAPPPSNAAIERRTAAGFSLRAWFCVGLVCLLTLGLLVGYVTSVMAHR
ncbi:MAG: hypothetical protein ABI895_02155 [Deltaproteobacteria bacterium]